MNVLKLWFLSRLLREKILVLALVLSGALIWLSSASTSLRTTTTAFRTAKSELETQEVWLSNRAAIEDAAKVAVSNLDPAKTYDATFLVAKVTSMAKNSGLAVNTEPPRTERSAQFSLHTVQVTTRRAELASLLRFYQQLASEAPYLALKQIRLQNDRSAPGMLNATIQITSVELLREAGANAVVTTAIPPK